MTSKNATSCTPHWRGRNSPPSPYRFPGTLKRIWIKNVELSSLQLHFYVSKCCKMSFCTKQKKGQYLYPYSPQIEKYAFCLYTLLNYLFLLIQYLFLKVSYSRHRRVESSASFLHQLEKRPSTTTSALLNYRVVVMFPLVFVF